MNLTTKIAPKGIDVVIDEIQNHLNTYITWSDFNCYPRIYKEETQQGVKPMVYTSSGDYEEVFYNDTLNGSCFFYHEDTRSAVDGYFNDVSLSIVFQLDLDALYPTITHRADEEAHNTVLVALQKLPQNKIVGLVTGYNNVYSEFESSLVKYDDISNYHCFRIDLKCIVNNVC
jgi:hypothetical protein